MRRFEGVPFSSSGEHTFSYRIGDHEIERVEEIKDLVVYLALKHF
jgi:hypothetical protein